MPRRPLPTTNPPPALATQSTAEALAAVNTLHASLNIAVRTLQSRINEQIDRASRDVLSAAEASFSPAQCRAARALLGWHQQTLADRTVEIDGVGLSRTTIYEFESAARPLPPETVTTIRTTLEDAGIRFVPNGVVMVKPQAQ